MTFTDCGFDSVADSRLFEQFCQRQEKGAVGFSELLATLGSVYPFWRGCYRTMPLFSQHTYIQLHCVPHA